MIAEGAAFWLINGATVLAAIGIVVVGSVFREELTATFRYIGWVTAIGLIATIVVPQLSIGPEELALWLQVAVGGVLVPIWAIWLGRALDRRAAAAPA